MILTANRKDVTMNKAKCEQYAKDHNLLLEVEGGRGWFGYQYEISIPEGMYMEDGTTGRSEYDLDVPKADVWALIWADMLSIAEETWMTREEYESDPSRPVI
jgi:hypothetical protein